MSRIINILFFGLVLPPLLTSLLFGLAAGVYEALPLISDMFAEGADRAELLMIVMEEVADGLLQSVLFYSVVAAPALALAGPFTYFVTRRPATFIVSGAFTGLVWGAFVDYYDSFFTGPGVEWDWPLGGAVYGLLVAVFAVYLLRKRNLL